MNNPPAFPNDAAKHPFDKVGMTLRDYFAANAMQGLLSSDVYAPLETFAKQSYKVADAMLAAREKL